MPKTNCTKILSIPTLLYVSECWALTKEQTINRKVAEMCFLRAVARCRYMDHKCTKDITEEPGITY